MQAGGFFAAPRRRAGRPKRGAETRVWCVFGAPGAGSSTVCRLVAEASEREVTVLAPTFGDLHEQLQVALARGPEVILVDGYPSAGYEDHPERPGSRGPPAGPAQLSYLYDRRVLSPGRGGLVHLEAPATALVQHRRASRGGLEAFLDALPALEDRARLLGLDWAVVHNEVGEEGLVAAVVDLARRTGAA